MSLPYCTDNLITLLSFHYIHDIGIIKYNYIIYKYNYNYIIIYYKL